MADVATTKLFENDKITVWEMVLEPGESSGVHTHVRDYVFFVLEGTTAELTDGAGEPVATFELKAGEVMSLRLEGQELVSDDLRLPATHAARNIGNTRYREILVETK